MISDFHHSIQFGQNGLTVIWYRTIKKKTNTKTNKPKKPQTCVSLKLIQIPLQFLQKLQRLDSQNVNMYMSGDIYMIVCKLSETFSTNH